MAGSVGADEIITRVLGFLFCFISPKFYHNSEVLLKIKPKEELLTNHEDLRVKDNMSVRKQIPEHWKAT